MTEGVPELAATVAASPQALHASSTTITSSADAILREEIERTRRMGMTGALLPLVALVLVPLFGGDARARAVLVASLAVFIAANAALYWLASDVRRFVRGHVAAAWAVATIGLLGVTTYFGPYSGALIALELGIYVAALGRDARLAVMVWAITAGGHAVLVGLDLGGVVADRGLLSSMHLSPAVRAGGAALLQVTFFAGFQLARESQRVARAAIIELERAVRSIAVREAMLQEARDDLQRAQRGGGGRYTDQVIGSFRLGDVLGRGGMGEVYEARHVSTDEPAAVKLLDGERGEVTALDRFLREVAIASSLRSRHVVRVLEVGDASAPVPYLAMERLQGADLGAWLHQHGRLPVEEVVELLRQTAIGVDEARLAGIVHRDLKPQNLFRAGEVGRTGPTWKVLDFGVSKLANHSGTLTQGAVVGTPQYMAPEQAAGLDVDHRADVYALAAIAFRCLTGRPPFTGASAPIILYQVVHDPCPAAAISPTIDAVLARALSKSPADRHPTAPDLAADLAAAAAAEP